VDVVVTNPGGQSGTLPNGYTYVAGPDTPTNLVATAASVFLVNITWNPALGADHYEVWKSFGGSAFFLAASSITPSYSDTAVFGSTTYIYKVRTVGPTGLFSNFSNPDIATTIFFDNDPIEQFVTPVRAIHVTQLRNAVVAVRLAAGLGGVGWTDLNIYVGDTPIRKVHVDELRTALTQARQIIFGVADPPFTDPILTQYVTQVKKIHIDELRQRTR
jgi:hypothetical protein